MSEHVYGRWPREDLAQFIPADAQRVLDVGCSWGDFLGTVRRTLPNAEVVGIEPNPEAAAEAGAICGHFPDDLPDGAPFDAIFFNDVLEHMPDPWMALRATKDLLSPTGQVIACIPNVRYWIVLRKLMLKRDFTYTETGVLDRTHLRFFTRSTMITMFEECGFEVMRCEALSLSTFWKARLLALVLGRDVLAIQFVVVARVSQG